MDGIDDPKCQGAVRYALDLLTVTNGVASLGLTPLSLSDFSFYDFELVTYLESQLRLTRPKK